MKLRNLVLSMLASMPLGLVSFAAKAALQDNLDQNAVRDLKKDLQSNRQLIFEFGSATASVAEAMNRFKSKTELKPELNVDTEFWNLINSMESKGMLQRHGEFLLAKTPSQY